MRLRQLLQDIEYAEIYSDAEVTSIAYDSRAVQPGALFIALRGERADGHTFVSQAVAAGASAVLVDRSIETTTAWARVADTRAAMWRLARAFYRDPTRDMRLVGVTGTNGKTTTTYLARLIMRHHGFSTALVGTLGAQINDDDVPIEHTTPEAPDLMRIFARARDAGAQAGVMEVSSHGIALDRVQACRFDVGVFTNLTQDHLDFHGTLGEYAGTKMRLFGELALEGGKPFVGVINVDDDWGARFVEATRGNVLTYGTTMPADICAESPQVGVKQIVCTLRTSAGTRDLSVPIGGRFNVWNILAAVGVGMALGVPLDTIVEALASARGVPGRFEAVDTGRHFDVIVDYAHTPDALEKLLRTARELNPNRLVVIFGCGGNRDKTKRPKMARIASVLADRCIVTSDNPRHEEPMTIIRDILPGLVHSSAEIEPDRREAIRLAMETAQPGDLVVIAGKGHEDYQIIGDTKYPFDDRQVVRDLLAVRA